MIYIATHKKFLPPRLEGYIPIQVGAEGKEKLGYLTDNTGENISSKNPNFCELTGIYWIWKNRSDEYKGLVHYRRYFGKSNLRNNFSDIYSYDELVEMLDCVDVVLPYIERFKQNARDEILISCCTEEAFGKLEGIIKEKYPEYIIAFKTYFSNNKSSLFNMMFCRKEVFDEYSEWLFDILFELEKSMDLNALDEYRKRLYGFLAERLLNIWIAKKKLRVKHVCVVHTEMPLLDRLQLMRRRLTNGFIYGLTKRWF